MEPRDPAPSLTSAVGCNKSPMKAAASGGTFSGKWSGMEASTPHTVYFLPKKISKSKEGSCRGAIFRFVAITFESSQGDLGSTESQ